MSSKKKKASGKLSKTQAKKMLPLVRKFNSIGNVFVKLLQKRVDAKRQKVKQIRVLVSGMPSASVRSQQHAIQITASRFGSSFLRNKFRRKKSDHSDADDGSDHVSIDLPWKNTDYNNRNRGVML